VELNTRSTSIVLQIGEAAGDRAVSAQTAVETSSAQLADTLAKSSICQLRPATSTPRARAEHRRHQHDRPLPGQLSTSSARSRLHRAASAETATTTTVDGVHNNDPIGTGPQSWSSRDAVREFTRLRNAFNAEYGQSTGGRNIVTKTGPTMCTGTHSGINQNRP
jgi:hypothetical protein